MFCVKEPSTLSSPWRLSSANEKDVVVIGQDTLKDLRIQDVLAINFLYQSYKSKLKGVILNEENDMNTKLQVAAFLGALGKSFSKQFLILVLAPDEFLTHWHYHLTQHAGTKVVIVTSDTRPEEFYEETNLALLLGFSNLKLAHCLNEYPFFSVVIDSFDTVAQKMIIRKLHGEMNIGLSTRNFYINPDQKLHWTMLNWSNPDVFGKLADFYEVDNENFASFRNSYKTWWFRLTWSFCDSFKPYTNQEKSEYDKVIKNLTNTNQIVSNVTIKKDNKIKKKVVVKTDKQDNIKEENIKDFHSKTKTVFKTRGKGKKPIKKIEYGVKVKENTTNLEKPDIKEEDTNSSVDTITYEHEMSNSQIIEEIENSILPEETDKVIQKSEPTSLENDLILSVINEPPKKRRKTNENIEEIRQDDKLDTALKNETKDLQNIIDSDDLILSFLPNSEKFLSKKDEDKIFATVSQSDVSQDNNKNKCFTLNRTSLDLDSGDSDDETASFIHTIVGNKSNKVQNGDSIARFSQKTIVDMQKLEDLLKETDEY